VDTANNLVEMTFRTKAAASNKKVAQLGLSDFKEGQNVVAVVKKVEEYGIFLRIEGSNVSGLCHKSEVSFWLFLGPTSRANDVSLPTTRRPTSRALSRASERAIKSRPISSLSTRRRAG